MYSRSRKEKVELSASAFVVWLLLMGQSHKSDDLLRRTAQPAYGPANWVPIGPTLGELEEVEHSD